MKKTLRSYYHPLMISDIYGYNMKVSTHLSAQFYGKKDSQQQILLIHGWGMNSAVWTDISEYLQGAYPEYLITAVDLPGYGKSASYSLDDLSGRYNSQSLAQSLLALLAGKETILIAWSMGGLVALELASIQQAGITKLIMVSSTPRFIQGEHWPNAVAAGIFEDFYQSLVKDHQATLKRFLAIQAMGSQTARQDTKYLYSQLFKRGQPDKKSLEYGLQMLLKEDKRSQLLEISNIPIALICGERDTLVHQLGQKQLAEQENITLYSIAGAGHAPFISHTEKFNNILRHIINMDPR